MRRLCDSLEEANKVLRQQLKLLQQRTADKGTAIIVEAVGLDEEPMVEEGDAILGEEVSAVALQRNGKPENQIVRLSSTIGHYRKFYRMPSETLWSKKR